MIGLMYGYNTTTLQPYYYQRNIFGDIIAIRDKNGNKVAEYAYDAWCNCTIVSGANTTLANYNPIRYRGYYYDRETKLYYLNTRYYNPEWRRFIQPADTSSLNPININGLNLYSYLNNNPISITYLSGGSGTNLVSVEDSSTNSQLIYGEFYINNRKKSLLNYSLYNASYKSEWCYANASGTLFYTTSQLRFHWSQDKKSDKARCGLFGKFSIFNTTGSIGIGNEYGIGLKGVLDIGTANLFLGYERKKSERFVGVKAGASLATARVGVIIDLGDHGIELGGSASLVTTGEFQIGLGSSGVVFMLGTPGPGGVGIYIRIY